MTETIKLMKAHTSVRRFKEQALPQPRWLRLGRISNPTL